MTDDRNDDGSFAIRPVGAAPLFDSRSGADAANIRWEQQKARNKLLVVKNVAKELGVDPTSLTYDEAFDHAILNPLVRASLKENIAAIKELGTLTGERPDAADAKIVKDQRSVNFNIYNLADRPAATRFIEDLKRAGEMTVAALIEAQVGEGDGPFAVKVPLE